jgi:AraC-like DNA-binding protein
VVELLTDIVLTVTGFQLLLLSVVLLTRTAAVPLQRNLLAGFLLSKAFLILRWFSYRFDILSYENSWQLYFPSAAGFFLLAPLLFLYVLSLCQRGFRLRARHLVHAIPFGLVVLAAVAAVLIWSFADEENPSALATALLAHFWDGFWLFNLAQILLYLVLMARAVRAYRSGLGETYSSLEEFDLRWLSALMIVAALHWLFVVSRGTLSIANVTAPNLLALLDLFSITIFLVFTTVLVIKGVGQLKVVPGLNNRPRHVASRMGADDLSTYAHRLDHLMATERPYLEPALTIDQLAARLAMPGHVLSQVINSAYKQNFFNYVNHYRVEAAKAQLGDPGCNQKTMLQILHEVGFNSKTTFNDAFKRHTSMTPSAFRKRAQGAVLS